MITNTVSTFEKSTAGSIVAYLSVTFLVVIISFIVPIKIPFLYIPPKPDVYTLSPWINSAPVGI